MLGGGAKGLIEVGAKAVCKRLFKELVDSDALSAAFLIGTLADVPSMKVQGEGASGQPCHSNRIEPAGSRFHKTAFLYRAQNTAVRSKTGICTFL